MVYCEQDMCESRLGRLMQAFRADRPSEWQMDEFIGMAEEMHKDIERLRQAEKDAERYRFIKKWNQSRSLNVYRKELWDEVVDKSMWMESQCNKVRD